MNYYTYRITNTKINKHYYGYRSTSLLPKDDLGIKYFSTSSDKDFIVDQKINKGDYKYKVIFVYDNKSQALLREIELHQKFNVKDHKAFYNLSNQTSTGFMCDNKGRIGLKGSENGRAKRINIYNAECKLQYTTFGNFKATCINHGLPFSALYNSYKHNGNPIFISSETKTKGINKGFYNNLGWYALYEEKPNHTLEEYHNLTNTILIKDQKNKNRLAKQTKRIKANSKEIKIYNNFRELMYTEKGDFVLFCNKNNLPSSALKVSYKKLGEPIFQSNFGKSLAKKNNHSKYIGWYAKIGDNLTENDYSKFVSQLKEYDATTRKKKSLNLRHKKLNSKKINIYDSMGILKFSTFGNFEEIINQYNLPYALGFSHRNNGAPIFTSKLAQTRARKNNTERYIGWYAKKIV